MHRLPCTNWLKTRTYVVFRRSNFFVDIVEVVGSNPISPTHISRCKFKTCSGFFVPTFVANRSLSSYSHVLSLHGRLPDRPITPHRASVQHAIHGKKRAEDRHGSTVEGRMCSVHNEEAGSGSTYPTSIPGPNPIESLDVVKKIERPFSLFLAPEAKMWCMSPPSCLTLQR